VTEYAKANVGVESTSRVFSLSEEFWILVSVQK
jgi:hypothetical protein